MPGSFTDKYIILLFVPQFWRWLFFPISLQLAVKDLLSEQAVNLDKVLIVD